MSDYIFNCPEGWILARSSTDNSLVPFFVHTMASCIHHKLDEEVDSRLIKIIGNKNVNVDFSRTVMKFTFNGWGVELNSDGSYKASKKIKLNDSRMKYTEDLHSAVLNVVLPFKTKDDVYMRFDSTVVTNYALIYPTITSIDLTSTKRNDGSFEEINVNIYNPNDIFGEARTSHSTELGKSSVMITIEGSIVFDEF